MADADAVSLLVDLMTELSVTRYNLGSCHEVEVTHINNPGDFYVRPICYFNHMKTLEAYEGTVEESKVIPGRVVVYKSQLGKRYVRGQIRAVRSDGQRKACVLFAMDYGFVETAFAKTLKNTTQESLPALSVHCKLEMCRPIGQAFDDKATEAMKLYVGLEAAKIVVRGQTSDKLVVQLINSCPDDISTMLAYSEVTLLGHASNIVNRFTSYSQPKLYFVYKRLEVGATLRVQVQSGDSLQKFYVADINDYMGFTAECGDLSRYLHLEPDMRAVDVKAGKLVALNNGCGMYERAVVKDVPEPEKIATLQFVDTGRVENVNLVGHRLKALEREYYFLRPALAIYCSTDDKQAWNNGLRKFLYPGYQFHITIKKTGKDHETPNIVDLTKIG